MTTGQQREIHYFKCTQDPSAAGYFSFSFKGDSTPLIPFTASQSQVKAALEKIPQIEEVDVQFTQGTQVCKNTLPSNVVSVEYFRQFGE